MTNSDRPISAVGHARAAAAGRAAQRRGTFKTVDVAFVSPLRRARETADVLSDTIDLPRFEVSDALAEVDALERETLADAVERIRRVMATLVAEHPDESVLAITHAGVIVASLVCRLAIPWSGDRAWLEPACLSMTHWQHTDQRWMLDAYNMPLNPAE